MVRKGGGRLSNGLSPAEDRVARLAARTPYPSNAEIGEVLHISKLTVDQHMWSAFRVFNVKNRVELRAAYKAAE